MKHLNKKSSAVLQKLIDCMSDPAYAKTMGSFAKIEKADSCFMPVSIEKLHHIPTFDNHIAVSHTYVENGDLMRDPEMEFVNKEGKFHPISFRQDNMEYIRRSLNTAMVTVARSNIIHLYSMTLWSLPICGC